MLLWQPCHQHRWCKEPYTSCIIADEASYGRDISESLRALGSRTGLQDIRFLAVAIGIQQKSGGNLAEILDGLAKLIRSRFKLFRKVKVITAEARWSGVFLSSFPIIGGWIGIPVDVVLMTPDVTPLELVTGSKGFVSGFFGGGMAGALVSWSQFSQTSRLGLVRRFTTQGLFIGLLSWYM